MRLTNFPCTLLFMQPARILFATNRGIILTMVAALLVLTLIILFVFIQLANRITRPIMAMADTLDHDPGAKLVPLRADAFRELNTLAESYNHAWERVREETRLREETYYEMLMSQISPHFIRNTVNSIKFLAEEGNRKQTVEALESLGDILQSVYSNKSDITIIGRELQLLSSYVKVMRMRFGYTFQYVEDIPFELYMCEIPSFTLQPLVENAILHGVFDKQAGQIVLSAQATDSEIQISVFNNGRCEDIQRVRQALSEEKRSVSQFTGIGLHNIHARLRMLYGESFGLTIDGGQDSGFEVIVHIPRKEVPVNVEGADC